MGDVRHLRITDEVDAMLRSLRGVWDEELVDELDHALQAATHAWAVRPDDDELLVAALLHDIAHAPALAGGVAHDQVARDWLTPRFGARVGWLAGAHVAAKRHLAATDPDYSAGLSDVSAASLGRQGGPTPVGPEWTTHEWWPDALLLRRCDDAAKVPGAPTASTEALLAAVTRVAGGNRW